MKANGILNRSRRRAKLLQHSRGLFRYTFLSFLLAVFAVIRATVKRFSDQEGMHLSAGIAYYALLSLFPVSLLLVSIFSFVIEADQVAEWVIERFGEETPVSLDFLRDTLTKTASVRGPLGFLGVFGTILTSTLVFAAIMRSINRAWGMAGTGKRTFLRRKLWELALLTALALFFLLAFAATSVFEVIRERPIAGYYLTTQSVYWTLFLDSITFFVMVGILLVLYKYVPTTQVRWRDVLLPAVLAAGAYRIANGLLSWYIGSLGYWSAIYGSLTSVIVLLLWVYICANILILGASMSAVLSTFGRKPAMTSRIRIPE